MLGTSNNHMCANNVASVSLNVLFAESLGKLETIMSKRGDAFRAKAYKKAQETVLGWPSALTNVTELKGAPGIGASVFDRLLELFQTGVISLIEEEKNNPINLLTDVYGIGPKKAAELVNVHGVTSIEQLRSRSELLNDVQRVGLKYYEDILQRIPRTEIQEYEKAFSLAATECVGTTFEIVGSYRRGAAHSGDIDVIITSIDVGAFKQFVDHLIREKVIIEVLSRGDCKCLVITRLPGHAVARRVDFLFSSKEEYAFAVLYFTGSKAFNTNMRQKALDMGYSLNEHCISAVINGAKVPVSSSFPTEKHIFDFLKMDYVVPSKRGDVAPVPVFATLSQGTTVVKTKKNVTKKRSTGISQKSGDSIAQTIRAEGFVNKVFDKYDETQLKTLLKEANNAYHNVVPFLSDAEFDVLESYIVGRFGGSGLSVGAPLPEEAGGKATLPYKMASMNKIKPGTGALAAWKQAFGKGPFILSSKLDGVSGLLNLVAGSGQASLYTRGDGETGQDVRWLIPYLGIPLNHDLSRGDICVRGEFIIPKEVFDNKYKTTFANPRNMVAGLINHKHMDAAFHEKIKDVHFVAYEVITPILKPSEQFAFLKKAGFECAYNHTVSLFTHLTEEHLSQVFGELKSGYLYETDGVIVCEDKVHPRPSGVSNPEYAFAFKMAMGEQMTRARVVAVHWSASKDGYLKPRVQIEPVTLCGVKIEYATGFNAAFIVQHRVGVGAVIEIIRSGDVIPHIKQVITPATVGAGLPTDCEYKWNETGVDIVLKNAGQDEGVVEKNVALFFAGMGVDGIGAGVVKKLCKAGFNSVPKIIHMTKEEMAEIDGLGEKSALKIKESIAVAIKKAEMVTWAAASNIFGRGFGERKMSPILEMYPNILLSNDSKEEKIKQVLQVKGIAEKSAAAFVENIARFNAFFVACNGPIVSLSVTAEAPLKKDVSHALFNKTVVLTGFRDKDFMQKLKDVGAIQGAAVSKNTFAVVVKNEGESSSKISNAKSLGVPIFFLQDFLTKFFV